MKTQEFLDYLRAHATTTNLAEEITFALVLRNRRAAAAAAAARDAASTAGQRIAS